MNVKKPAKSRAVTFIALSLLLFLTNLNAEMPERLTDFELINQSAKTVRLSDFKGKVVFLSFIFTRCPMSTMCPLLTSKMKSLEQMLFTESKNDYIFLTVSFDSDNDSPQVLEEYGRQAGVNFENWHFLTGHKEEIQKLTKEVELYYEKDETGSMDHNMRSLILDREGFVQFVYNGSDWKSQKVLHDIRKVIARV